MVVVVRTQCNRSVFVQAPALVQLLRGCQTPRDKSQASASPDPTLCTGRGFVCVNARSRVRLVCVVQLSVPVSA